jgi:hypothetical protein
MLVVCSFYKIIVDAKGKKLTAWNAFTLCLYVSLMYTSGIGAVAAYDCFDVVIDFVIGNPRIFAQQFPPRVLQSRCIEIVELNFPRVLRIPNVAEASHL